MLLSTSGHAARGVANRFPSIAPAGGLLQLARAEDADARRLFGDVTVWAPRRTYSQASSAPVQPAARTTRHPVVTRWDERAARLSIFQLLKYTAEQRDGCDHLLAPRRRTVMTQDPLTLGMLGGRRHELDHVLSGHGAGVLDGLRLLGLGDGDAVALLDPHDLRLAVHLAAQGCHCSIMASPRMLCDVTRLDLLECRHGAFAQVLAKSGGTHQELGRESAEYARQVARRMAVVASEHPVRVPQQGGWRAMMALSMFQRYPTVAAVAQDVFRAGTLLEPGGGLVFQFPHVAGSPMHPMDDRMPTLVGFSDIVDAAQGAQLQLRCVHVTYRHISQAEQVVHAERVMPADNGLVSFRKADEAAWAGWEKVFDKPELNGQAMHVEVSGVLVKSPGVRTSAA